MLEAAYTIPSSAPTFAASHNLEQTQTEIFARSLFQHFLNCKARVDGLGMSGLVAELKTCWVEAKGEARQAAEKRWATCHAAVFSHDPEAGSARAAAAAYQLYLKAKNDPVYQEYLCSSRALQS